MKKRTFLILLSIVIAATLFTLIFIEEKEEKELTSLHKASLLVKELNIDKLTLRRNEKDFLFRNHKIYLSKFTENHIIMQKNITQLVDNLKHRNIDTKLLLEFSNSINTYANSFKKLANKRIVFGLNENDGKYLQLREAAHSLLEIVKSDKTLLSKILELRRNEKDFLLRKTLKYEDLFNTNIQALLSTIKNKEIINLLIKYKTRFFHLVKLQEEIGLNENLGYTGQMREAVHKSEVILETLSKQLIKDIDIKSFELIRLTEIFLITIFLIIIFVIILLVNFFTSETKVNQLTNLNEELSQTLQELEKTQDKLIEAEKLASLGGLVAGVAHEINTPLGIALTGITYFDEISENIHKLYDSEDMTKEEFEKYLNDSKKISLQVLNNIRRTANLVNSFKQVSADQTSEVKREFYIKDYTDGIILSVSNQIKKTKIKISNNIPKDVKINSYPGAFGQIITNLILNSIIHGYSNNDKGHITISLRQENSHLILNYKDDGKGIQEKDLPHIFEPFFTTKRGLGGTGLGLNILYNIIRKQFHGQISCKSKPNEGVDFEIIIYV